MITNVYGSHSCASIAVQLLYATGVLTVTLLPMCTAATVQLLYAIRIFIHNIFLFHP